MRTIKGRFYKVRKHNEYWSDYICLAEAVARQGFKRETIGIWFRELVPTDDYDPKEANRLITQLYKLSKLPEDTGFETKTEQEHTSNPKDEHCIVSPITNSITLEKVI